MTHEKYLYHHVSGDMCSVSQGRSNQEHHLQFSHTKLSWLVPCQPCYYNLEVGTHSLPLSNLPWVALLEWMKSCSCEGFSSPVAGVDSGFPFPGPARPPPRSHSGGLLDAVEADPGWGGGDGHGPRHSHSEGMVVLPTMPSLPGSRAHLPI